MTVIQCERGYRWYYRLSLNAERMLEKHLKRPVTLLHYRKALARAFAFSCPDYVSEAIRKAAHLSGDDGSAPVVDELLIAPHFHHPWRNGSSAQHRAG